MKNLTALTIFLWAAAASSTYGASTSGDWNSILASGGVDSGGGKSIVCRNPEGKISSATLLDLFEGKYLFKREPLSNQDKFEDQFQAAAARIRDANTNAYVTYLRYLGVDGMQMFRSTIFLPKDIKLEPTDDAVQVIVPIGCKVEQAAAFNTRLDRLILDSEIWESFDETNRAALLLHEVLYDNLRRKADERDSFYTRQVVSFVMSLPQLPKVDNGVPDSAYFCQSFSSKGERKPNSAFYVYESPQGDWVYQWIYVNRAPVFAPAIGIMRPDGEISLAQLVGAAPYMGNGSFRAVWAGTPGRGSAVDPGWVNYMRLSQDPQDKEHRLKLNVGFHRSGETGDEMEFNQVQCWPKKP